jgi:hypothetical protein
MQKKNIEKLAEQERRRYFKEWREKNKARVKKYNQSYWSKRALKRIDAEQNGGTQ